MNERIIVVGTLSEISREYKRYKPREIVLIGASSTNMLVARFLEGLGYRPKLIELDENRARIAAEKLNKTIVLNHNAFDIDYWYREKLDHADIVVSGLESDEKTLFASLIAQHLGARRVFAIIHDTQYLPLFEKNNIVATSPENVTAERIILSIMRKDVEGIVSVIPGVEVLLVEVDSNSPLNGKYVNEIPVIVGPIIRRGEILVPVEETKITIGDRVTLIVPKELVGVIEI